MRQDDYQRAIVAYGEAITLDPENAESLYRRALAYDRDGVTDKARTDYAGYIRLAPSGPYAEAVRARLRELRSSQR